MGTNFKETDAGKPSKKRWVREHLLTHGSIEPMEALEKYGSYRLGAIIFELRHDEGMDIRTERVEGKSRLTGRPQTWAKYIYVGKKDSVNGSPA